MTDQNLDHARDLAAELVTALGPKTVPPPTTPPIDTPDALDRALSTALPGATLVLSPRLVYPGPLTIRTPVTLQCEGELPASRIALDRPLPRFLDGLTMPSDQVFLLGLEVKKVNPLVDIVSFAGARVMIDRCRILGDPDKGAKRGIAAGGNGACAIVRTVIEDCFQASPGSDSQAIFMTDMAPGLLIEDCWLSGGSETVLFGGSDNTSDARTPADVTIRGCTITARPAWQALPIGVKTRLEFKNAKRVLVEHCVIENCWRQGQTGYLLTLSVRNQDGRAPWVTVEDVTIRDNTFAHGAAAINILGRDDIKETKTGTGRVPIGQVRPSVPLSRVTIADNSFTDLDPKVWTNDPAAPGSNKLIQVGGGPIDLTIDGNAFAMRNCGSQVYFQSGPPCERFRLSRNTLPKSAYGIFGVNSTPGQAWDQYVSSGVLGPNTVTP
jgi:hypothetical protein